MLTSSNDTASHHCKSDLVIMRRAVSTSDCTPKSVSMSHTVQCIVVILVSADLSSIMTFQFRAHRSRSTWLYCDERLNVNGPRSSALLIDIEFNSSKICLKLLEMVKHSYIYSA